MKQTRKSERERERASEEEREREREREREKREKERKKVERGFLENHQRAFYFEEYKSGSKSK